MIDVDTRLRKLIRRADDADMAIPRKLYVGKEVQVRKTYGLVEVVTIKSMPPYAMEIVGKVQQDSHLIDSGDLRYE